MKNTTSNKPNYTPEVCSHCGQRETYLLAIDKGTAHIVEQIARFVGRKGINAVHPRKEMEGAWLTSNEVGNLTRARAHGLIAKIPGNPGNYCLTSKGAAFLKGAKTPKYAIRSKVQRKTIGYVDPDTEFVTVSEFHGSGEYWNGIDFEIVEGRIIRPVDIKNNTQPQN